MNVKSTIPAITLAFVAATSVAHGQSLTANLASEHSLTRAEVVADLAAWRASGLADAYAGKATPDVFSAAYRAKFADYQRLSGAESAQALEHTLTRAEVIADLDAWRASGLAKAYAGKTTPNVFSTAYQAKLADYRQLTGSQDTQASENSVTRAEVIADLNAWRASGLEKAYAGKTTPNVFSTAYQAKLTHYRQLTQQG